MDSWLDLEAAEPFWYGYSMAMEYLRWSDMCMKRQLSPGLFDPSS